MRADAGDLAEWTRGKLSRGSLDARGVSDGLLQKLDTEVHGGNTGVHGGARMHDRTSPCSRSSSVFSVVCALEVLCHGGQYRGAHLPQRTQRPQRS